MQLTDLTDDCLLATLRYCDSRLIAKMGFLSRRFKRLVEQRILWSQIDISGPCASAAAFIARVLTAKAHFVNSISFESLTFTEDSIAISRFFAAVETLLKRIGPELKSVRIDDTVDSLASQEQSGENPFQLKYVPPSGSGTLFTNLHMLMKPLGSYCKNIKRIQLSGDEDGLVGDTNILMLTNCCPLVESFVNESGCGITPQAVRYMVDGWKSLHSLALDTENMSVHEFADSVGLFGNRLTNLSITSFECLLDSVGYAVLVKTLKKLTKLEVLAIDLSATRGLEGVDAQVMRDILDACPRLKGFEYFSTLESYFEFDDDEDFRIFSHGGDGGSAGGAEDDESFVYRFNASSPASRLDPSIVVETWRSYKDSRSIYGRSRQGSLASASMSMITTRFGRMHHGNFNGTLSVFSKDDRDHGDASSMAGGLPSPSDRINRVEVYGTWMTGDALSIRERALKILGFESGSDFFVGKQEIFFAILDGIHAVCLARGVKVTFAWSI